VVTGNLPQVGLPTITPATTSSGIRLAQRISVEVVRALCVLPLRVCAL
jgi:hypothetical protein